MGPIPQLDLQAKQKAPRVAWPHFSRQKVTWSETQGKQGQQVQAIKERKLLQAHEVDSLEAPMKTNDRACHTRGILFVHINQNSTRSLHSDSKGKRESC